MRIYFDPSYRKTPEFTLYLMRLSILCDSLSYATLYLMRLSILCDSLSYATLYLMRLSILCDSLSYATLYLMRKISAPFNRITQRVNCKKRAFLPKFLIKRNDIKKL